MKKLTKIAFLFTVLSIALTACNPDKTVPALVIPTTYESANFTANTATQTSIGNRLTSMTTEAKKGRVAGKTVSNVSELLAQVASLQPGVSAEINIWRRQGEVKLQLTPAERPIAKKIRR